MTTSGVRRVLARLVHALRPARGEPDLSREVAAHLALLEDDFVRHGLPADEARLAARRAFGGVEQTKERHRDARSFIWLDDVQRDLQHGLRLLRRNPLFTLTASLSLAIGLGASTTVFIVANALLRQSPVGVAEPGRLVDIGSSRNRAGFGPVSFLNYLDLRDRATTLAGVCAESLLPRALGLVDVNGPADGDRVFGTGVTANYFNVLGALPAAGRLFDASRAGGDDASAVVVVSHRFWRRRYNADPAIVGGTVALNGHPFTVIGVASEGFHGTGVRSPDLWVPLGPYAGLTASGAASLTNRASALLLAGARLKREVSIAQAASEVDAIGLALAREHPEDNRSVGLRAQSLSPVPGAAVPVAVFLTLVMAIALIVLVVACANLAGVLLARAAARRREIAVRLAMGASRGRLVRQLLAETLMLVVLGGFVGLVLTRALMSLTLALLPALPFPLDVSLALDGSAVAFAALLVLAAALLSGLAPAIHASKADVVSALHGEASSRRGLRLRHAFVVAQVALSLLLVVMAGLFVRALHAAGSSDPGFESAGVELVSLDLAMGRYTAAGGVRFARELLDRVRTLPDIERASIATVLPGGFETQRRSIRAPGSAAAGAESAVGVDWNVIETDYFATLRIVMTAGREFSPADREGTLPVAIVSDALAQRLWPGQPALGQYVSLNAAPNARSSAAPSLQVVGVAHDVKSSSLVDGLARAMVYVPLEQQYAPGITIVARAARGHPAADEIRTAITAMDPDLPIVASQTLADSTTLGLIPQRVAVSVSGCLGLVGLLLAAIGMYGVTAYAVTQRTREIGIRIALGARQVDTAALIVRRGMSLVAVGSAIGLLLAVGAGRASAAFLFGVPPFDLRIFAGAAALFAGVALAACLVPARRAATVDPSVALRHD